MKSLCSKILAILLVFFSVCNGEFFSCLSTSAHALSQTAAKTDEERKREILKNYPPNLSEMQEVGFGVKAVAPNGELIEQRVRPDAHFRGEDGKEYLVFYNHHIAQLQNLIYNKLKQELDGNPYTLSYDKNALLEKAERSSLEQSNKLPIQLTRLAVNVIFWPPWFYNGARKIISLANSEVSNRAKLLATTSANLNSALQAYGSSLDNSDSACTVVVDRELTQFVTATKQDHFSAIEREFFTIMGNPLNKRLVEDLDQLLEKYLQECAPHKSNMNAVNFCFPLNRASYYLSNLERDLQSKDLETLEAMYALRKKVNRLTLEYRFIFDQNVAPILGIYIDRCKIIVDTERRTMIFLDADETRKFIDNIEKKLDTKASDISRRYSFESFSGAEFRVLAEKLQPESYQDIIDNLDKQIDDLEVESSKSMASALVGASRAAVVI